VGQLSIVAYRQAEGVGVGVAESDATLEMTTELKLELCITEDPGGAGSVGQILVYSELPG
jgi:hypothetical protein